ncbi:hypothetical protein ACSBPH_01675 [Microbacterium sp. F51-2R]|uniref:hypothetical protein n=1 Tax=Microbacterium sp. F51-2R TaxID=3445777 RepID=UPI003FA086F9
MTERIAVPDGGIWVRPSLERDDEVGLGWKLRHAPDSLSRADQITLAEIVDAYGYLLVQSTTEQRNRVCAAIRRHIHREQTND